MQLHGIVSPGCFERAVRKLYIRVRTRKFVVQFLKSHYSKRSTLGILTLVAVSLASLKFFSELRTRHFLGCVETCRRRWNSPVSVYLDAQHGYQCSCTTLNEIDRCPDLSIRKDLALMMHFSNVPDFPTWKKYIRNVDASKLSYDIHINCRTSEIASRAIRVFGSHVKVTLDAENKGMDIGGFFVSILSARKACLEYDFVIKLHGKENTGWLHRLVDPLIGSPMRIRHLSQVFKYEEVGQVFASPKIQTTKTSFPERLFLSYGLDQDIRFFLVTAAVEDGILDSLGLSLKRSDRFFMAGTMLAFKWQLLQQALPSNKLLSEVLIMNSPKTFDANWFSLMSRNIAHEVSQLKLPGNSLLAHHSPGYMPDGQLEHGWERVLCYLSSALGYETKLIGASNGEEQSFSEWLTVSTRKLCFDVDRGSCLRDAGAGECLLTPAYMLSRCKSSCICVHGESGYPNPTKIRDDLEYFIDILHHYRSTGPFSFVASSYQNILDCNPGVYASTNPPSPNSNKDTLLQSPFILSKKNVFSSCSRVLSLQSGNQLHLGRDGILRLQDRSYRLLWSSSMMKTPRPRQEERGFSLSIINTKPKLACLTIQGISTGDVYWQSSPFEHREHRFAKLVVEDKKPCVRLLNDYGEVWAQC